MANAEKDFFVSNQAEFQSVIGYEEVEKSPPLVVRQTNTLLELYYQGAIWNPKPAKDYLHDYTLGYLRAAEEGSAVLYDRIGRLTAQDTDLETREAASHAFVILTCLPDRAKSPFLPKGFSRRGMLKAPETRNQFLARIRELKVGIWQIAEGKVKPYATLEAYPPLLKVFKFFEVGSELPVKLTEDKKRQEQIEREKFNDLLGGVDIAI